MQLSGMSALVIALGGAAGALSRWIIAVMVNRIFPDFPIGTLLINVLGSFLLGWLMASEIGSTLRVGLAIGFLGAFTTFSTFMYESNALANEGAAWGMVLNLGLSLALGLVAVRLGLAMGGV